MTGRLEAMFHLQRMLMDEMGVSAREQTSDEERKRCLAEAALGLVEESLEVFKDVNKFKPWDSEIDTTHAVEELIDVMHYLIECLLLLGTDQDDFFITFTAKHETNLTRIKRGKEDL